MRNKLIYALCVGLYLFAINGWADESMQYNQKTLPNGDVETSMSSSDGTKTLSVQHKDGSVETTVQTADGTKTVSVQHADGSVDTKVTPGH